MKGSEMLIVPGTGLLTDAYGLLGWGPYNLMKWTLAARLRGCRVLFVSVGAGPLYSTLGRFCMRFALALADYRSFRDRLVVFVEWLLARDYDVRLLLGDSDKMVIDEFTSLTTGPGDGGGWSRSTGREPTGRCGTHPRSGSAKRARATLDRARSFPPGRRKVVLALARASR
jgi:hypothetical protein